MIDLGALKIGIKVDKDSAIGDMKEVSGVAESTQSKFAGFGQKLKTGAMIGGAAVVGAVGTMSALATKASETTDRIDKMSLKLGMSREGFQEWDYILGQNGISIDGLQGGMKTLTNMTDDLRKGTATATDAFGMLGLSHDDLKGKTQEEIFDMTITALQGMEDETQRAAVANDLLGRSGAELAPLLAAGADGADDLRKRAHELGIIMGDDAVDAGVLFGDTMDDLKKSFGAVFTQLGTELMPIFQELMDWVLAHMPEIKAFVAGAFEAIRIAVGVASRVFKDVLMPVIESVWKIFKNSLLPALESIYDFVAPYFPVIAKIVTGAFDIIGGAVEAVTKVFSTLVGGIEKAWNWLNKWNKTPADNKTVTTYQRTVGTRGFDGTHAAGLDYVPYDGYIAQLHKGERVVPASENNGNTMNHTGTITVKGINSKNELEGVVEIVMSQLRREVRMA